MQIIQLDPPLHMQTPKGPGIAHFMINYGPEADLMWVVFMDADGASWTVANPEIRLTYNWTMGRRPPARDEGKGEQPAPGQRFRPTIAAATES